MRWSGIERMKFDFERGPLFRAVLVRSGNRDGTCSC